MASTSVLILVPIERDALRLLKRRAQAERRRPQDEAALLLERILRGETPQKGELEAGDASQE